MIKLRHKVKKGSRIQGVEGLREKRSLLVKKIHPLDPLTPRPLEPSIYFVPLCLCAVLALSLCLSLRAYGEPISIPSLNIGIGSGGSPADLSTSLKIILLITILSLAPAILIMLTSFARIIIVLSFLRQALGTQQMPPNQILVGLALFLTFFIMHPVFDNINKNAFKPYMENNISQEKAFEVGIEPLRNFMFKQTREKDIALFIDISKMPRPSNRGEVPTHVLIPAFIISELKTAFQIGFLIYIPFLILDMVVASVLMSMGMLMLPPIVISLPFKLMLFVMVDGWNLIVGSLVNSFV